MADVNEGDRSTRPSYYGAKEEVNEMDSKNWDTEIEAMVVSERVKKTAKGIRILLNGLTYEEAQEALQIAGENLESYAVIQLHQ